jgi:hypothetical protein
MLEKKGKLKEADKMPEVSDGEGLILSLFHELSTGRSLGMSVGPIPISLFWEAQRRYNLSNLAIYVLQQLDGAYLRKINGSSGSRNSV